MEEKIAITIEQMKKWRERNRFSMAQAAHRAGVDRSTWSKWERGIARPTPANDDQLRSIMADLENPWKSTRREEAFGQALDDELKSLLDVMTISQEIMGVPLGFRTGPMADDMRMQHLVRWFSSYFRHPQESMVPLGDEQSELYFCIKHAAAEAGFCVGKLKYAASDDEAEEWYRAAEAIFIDLMALKKMFQRDNPKKAKDLWQQAFGIFDAGYALALDQACWPDSAWYELRVLGGMLVDSSTVPTVRSVISPEDFGDPQHRLMFRAVLNLLDQGHVLEARSIEDEMRLISTPGATDESRVSWPVYSENSSSAPLVGHIYKTLPEEVDANDLTVWVREIKKRSLNRKLMDGCRKVSAGLERDRSLDIDLDEIERTISQLRSLNAQRETRHDDR